MLAIAAPAAVAAWSAGALDRALEGDAEILIASFDAEAMMLGAFQRACEIDTRLPIVARGSGGAAARVGPGSLYVGLALRRHDVLAPCPPARMMNRSVRPLLRALTKSGARAEYTGRDWIGVLHRPVAMLGFAHDASSGRALVEAVVGVSTCFALDEERRSFNAKRAASIDDVVGHPTDVHRLAHAIEAAYALREAHLPPHPLPSPAPASAPAWAATAEIPIGLLGAGRDAGGVLRLGGELLASRDAVEKLEARLAALSPSASREDRARAVDETLGAPGVVVEGVGALVRVLDVVEDALRRETPPP